MRKVDFSVVFDLFGVSVTGVLGTGLGVLVRVVPYLHLVVGGWCRWCLRFPRHLGALLLLVVRGGALG